MMRLTLFILLQALGCGWLELPAPREQDSLLLCRTHYAALDTCTHVRNYSLLYDPATFASCWVAYPLCRAHLAAGREDSWAYDPSLPDSLQTGVFKNYSTERFRTEHYKSNYYARGHQIPNADRNASVSMQAQTYYATNMTPQIQNGFNGLIWAKLEKGLRDAALTCPDTLYLVTGASLRRADLPDSTQTVQYVVNRNDGKRLPVPRWYWKAALKVRRDSLGRIEDAGSIAFFLPHRDLKGHQFSEYAVSVDSLEVLTGFDLFPALPDSIEVKCERSSSWKDFLGFEKK